LKNIESLNLQGVQRLIPIPYGIPAAMDEQVTTMEPISQAAEKLKDISEELAMLISRFKV
jgi:hypothetical protein